MCDAFSNMVSCFLKSQEVHMTTSNVHVFFYSNVHVFYSPMLKVFHVQLRYFIL